MDAPVEMNVSRDLQFGSKMIQAAMATMASLAGTSLT